MSAPPIQLDYGRPHPLLSRRSARRTIVATLSLMLAILAVNQRDHLAPYWESVQQMSVQARYLEFSISPNQLVYEDDRGHVPDLLDSTRGTPIATSAGDEGRLREVLVTSDHAVVAFAQGSAHSVFVWDHPMLQELWSRAAGQPLPQKAALVFLHERFTPAGERVILVCLAVPLPSEDISLLFCEFHPATWSHPIARRGYASWSLAEIRGAIAAGKHLRIYAGQPDPQNATHFTIRCEIDGAEATLDGWDRTPSPPPGGMLFPTVRLGTRRSN